MTSRVKRTTQATTIYPAMKANMAKPLNPVIPDYRPKAERTVKDEGLPLKPCIVCKKMTQGYGVFHEGVVCCKDHNTQYENARAKLIDHVIPRSES